MVATFASTGTHAAASLPASTVELSAGASVVDESMVVVLASVPASEVVLSDEHPETIDVAKIPSDEKQTAKRRMR